MSQALRSLSGFIDFECAARWGSFKLAAKELHKTPAAISQQIKQLEQQLGFPLFVRYPRHIALTDKGQQLASTVASCLAELSARVTALRACAEQGVVRISLPHSLSMKWLVPRLADFSLKHPAIDLRIDTRDEKIDIDSGLCDMALRITTTMRSPNAQLLGREQLIAVYSPKLEKPRQPLTAASLNELPLLYQQNPETWLQWMQLNQLLSGKHNFSRNFSHSGVLVQAAVAGQGLALVPYIIAHEDLQQGTLKVLPGKPLDTDCYYYALVAAYRTEADSVVAVKGWLAQQFEQCLRDSPFAAEPRQETAAR